MSASKNVEENTQDTPEDEFGAKDFRAQMQLKLGKSSISKSDHSAYLLPQPLLSYPPQPRVRKEN